MNSTKANIYSFKILHLEKIKNLFSPLQGFLKGSVGACIGFSIVGFFLLIALFSPYLAPYSYDQVFADSAKLPPFWVEGSRSEFILGTDDIGRDLLSRLIYGCPVSLGIGFMVVILAVGVGSFLGLLAGTLSGWVDQVLSRIVDILMSLPSILMAIVIVSILGSSLQNAVIAVGIVSIPSVFRLVRGAVIVEMKKNYVTAVRSFGASWYQLAIINVLPNCLAPIIVQATLGFSEGILSVAALGFLGLGAQPPIPEWGTILSDARAYIESSPWMVTLPGLCILLVVVGFNLIGDSLRDFLDPKLKKA